MTLHDAALYFEYAAAHPTVRTMVAGYLGIKPPRRGSMDELLGELGEGRI